MRIPFVDLRSQYLSIQEEIDQAIYEVINSTSFIGGQYVQAFEKEFAHLYGAKHCIGVGNGTDAIYIALKMLGIKEGDEVITTASSWISTSETISQTGARPVFVDIDKFFTIDPSKLAQHITKRTKAVIPVHLYGQPAEMDKIQEICSSHNLHLIEDCAQAHFSEYKNTYTGKFGIASTFSFYPGKNLGAYGDAGAIITDDDSLAEKCRMYANHGALKKHHHLIEGINSRLDGLQANILKIKLRYILKWTNARAKNAALYTQLLHDIPAVEVPQIRENSKHTFHLYVIKADKRDELKKYLDSKGIETSIHYPTILPLLPCYRHLNHKPEDFPVAFSCQQKILSLPMFPELTQEQIHAVSRAIREFYNG